MGVPDFFENRWHPYQGWSTSLSHLWSEINTFWGGEIQPSHLKPSFFYDLTWFMGPMHPKVMVLDWRSWLFRKSVTNVSQFWKVTITPLQRNQYIFQKKTTLPSIINDFSQFCVLRHPKVMILDGRLLLFRKLVTNVSHFWKVPITPMKRNQYFFASSCFWFPKVSILINTLSLFWNLNKNKLSPQLSEK